MSEWKKCHKLGYFGVNPKNLLPPDDAYAAREFNQAHVTKLAKAFQLHGKTNQRGIRVLVTNPELWSIWADATDASKEALVTPGSEFYLRLMASGLKCPTGDHSSHALQELQVSQPLNPMWQWLPKVKFYLCAGTDDDNDKARLMGNADNERAALHKEVDVVDKMAQLHKNYLTEIVAASKPGYSKKKGLERRMAYAQERCAAWNMHAQTFKAMSTLAKFTGQNWVLFMRLMKGDYPSAPHNKDGTNIPLTTHSQFTSLTGLDDALRIQLMTNIINGNARICDLRTTCLRHMAGARIKSEILALINTQCCTKEMKKAKVMAAETWEKAEVVFPNATSVNIQRDWVVAFSKLPQKTPAPKAFQTSVKAGILLDEAKNKAGSAEQKVLKHAHTCSSYIYPEHYLLKTPACQ